jgi:hypothetical protein
LADTPTLVQTYEHIRQVQELLRRVVVNLLQRAEVHDVSKLASPEAEVFEKYVPLLRDTTYGSAEYQQFLREMQPALQHHYRHNRHHPEHHEAGIRGMNLVDVLEMLCDWKAATLRHHDGDIRRSVELNQQRFGYSDELKQILLNTLVLLEQE